ncbi:MAG: MFS transporter [Acidobacteria bacterium]|nr:MFS transporter [Acidobacteriota bacterium]
MSAPVRREGGWRDAFIAFRYRNFSLMWCASLLSSSGTWLQNVAVPFVVFRITGSGAWLGVTGFLSYVPMVITGPLAGSIADRFDRRRVLMVCGLAQTLLTLALWLDYLNGERRILVIIVLLAANSTAAGFAVASWQAFVTELVPREHLLNAVTLNSAQFNAARAFGPAIGGVVLATLGASWSFFINAMTFVAMVVALLFVHVARIERPPRTGRSRPLREMVEAIRYVRTQAGIMACLVVVFALGFFGGPLFNLLVVFADRVYGIGDGAYGLLAGCLGAGAIIAAPFVAGRGGRTSRSTMLSVAMVGYGIALISLAAAPVAIVGAIALLFAGAGYLGISSTLNTTVQMQVAEVMRGRVLALYVMVLTVAIPIGSLIQGWLVDLIGVQWTVAGAGTLFLGVFAVLRFGVAAFGHMDDLTQGTVADTRLAIAEAEAIESAIDPI